MGFFILLDQNDKIVMQVESENHPCDPPAEGAAPAYDWNRAAVVQIPRLGDLEIEEWRDGEWHVRLEPLKARFLRQIDAQRLVHQRQHLSDLPSHERKRNELMRFDASGGSGEYPWLAAEASAKGMTIEQVAELVRTAVNAAEALAAGLEGRALDAKTAIRDAQNADAANAAFNAIDWG